MGLITRIVALAMFAAMALAIPPAQSAEGLATVSGTVSSSNGQVTGGDAYFYESCSGGPSGEARIFPDGYTVDLAPGTYKVEIHPGSGDPATYSWHSAANSCEDAATITVPVGGTTVALVARPVWRVAGTVSSNHGAVTAGEVYFYKSCSDWQADDENYSGYAEITAGGRYNAWVWSSGTHKVFIDPKHLQPAIPSWHAAAKTCANAATISVTSVYSTLNLTASPATAVSGTVSSNAGVVDRGEVNFFASCADEQSDIEAGWGDIYETGYRASVAPGTYKVLIRPEIFAGTEPAVRSWHGGVASCAESPTITVSGVSDAVNLTASPGVLVTGKVSPVNEGYQVYFYDSCRAFELDDSGDDGIGEANVGHAYFDESGAYRTRLPAGTYRALIDRGDVPDTWHAGKPRNACAEATPITVSGASQTVDLIASETGSDIVRYPRSDISGDGIVDIRDLSRLIAKWGTADPDADVNQDGKVSVIDVSMLISDWGKRTTTGAANAAVRASGRAGGAGSSATLRPFGIGSEVVATTTAGIVGNGVTAAGVTTPVLWSTRTAAPTRVTVSGVTDAAVFGVSKNGYLVGSGKAGQKSVAWYRLPNGRTGVLDGAGSDAYATSVSDAGVITGFVHDGRARAVRWDRYDRAPRRLDAGTATATTAVAVSAAGSVVGDADDQVALWNAAGRQLRRWPGSALDINTTGTVLFRGSVAGGRKPAIARGGTVTYMPGLPGLATAKRVAVSVNDAGVVAGSVGTRPVVWQPGRDPKALPLPAGFASGRVSDVAADGTAFGWVARSGQLRKAYVWPATTPVRPAAPGRVSGLRAKYRHGKAVIRWRAVQRADFYRVRMSKPGGKKYRAKWRAVEGTKYIQRLKRARTAKKYAVKVRAVGQGGSSPSRTIRFRVPKKR